VAGCETLGATAICVVKRIPKNGGAVEQVASLAFCPASVNLVADGEHLFAIQSTGGRSWIWDVPPDGGTTRIMAVLNGHSLGGVADATHLYWLQQDGDAFWSLRRMAKSGGTAEVLADALQDASSLDLGDADVFVALRQTADNAGSILRIDKETGVRTSIAGEGALVVRHASGFVYFSTGSTLARVPDSGGSVQIIARRTEGRLALFEARDGDVFVLATGTSPRPCPETHFTAMWADGSSSNLGVVGSGVVALDQCALYWATGSCFIFPTNERSIMRRRIEIPRVQSLSATRGPTSGGHTLTIHGSALDGVDEISLCVSPVHIMRKSPSEIEFVTSACNVEVVADLFLHAENGSTVVPRAYAFVDDVSLRARRPVRP
jgi:hypothetical protein